MEIEHVIPGVTTAGDAITITVGAPGIAAVIAAEIERVPVALAAHPAADIVAALANHTGVEILAAIAVHTDAQILAAVADHSGALLAASIGNHTQAQVVNAILDHAVHAHDLLVGAAGAPGDVYGAVAGGTQHIVAAAVNLVAGAGATGIRNNAAAQAHGAGVGPLVHAGAADLAHAAGVTAVPHDAGGAPVVHGAALAVTHAAATPVVGANPIIITTRTFELDVNTLLGDIIILYYLAVGERVPVS